MNRKRPVARAPRKDVRSAMSDLLDGYRSEANLYLRVRRLTWKQREMLQNGLDLNLFRGALEEKEELLRTIARVESEMKTAKSLVLAHPPSQCPDRLELEMLLDQLTGMIEEIRIVEKANASCIGLQIADSGMKRGAGFAGAIVPLGRFERG